MYTITAILEVGSGTNPAEFIRYFENEIAPLATNIPGVERIDCVQLQSIPFSENDKQPLQNIFYQMLAIFETEEAVQTALQNEDSIKLLNDILSFSSCKFHWFVGSMANFISNNTKLIAK